MDPDHRKPGSRDGKKKNGGKTVRKVPQRRLPGEEKVVLVATATRSDSLPHVGVNMYGQRGQKDSANADGFVQGVDYSLGKKKRWEMVGALAKDEDTLVVNDNVAVVGNTQKDRRLQRQLKEKLREKSGPNNNEEKAAPSDDVVVQTRAGPVVKKNVSRRKQKKNAAAEDSKEPSKETEIAEVYYVSRKPSKKEAAVICRDGNKWTVSSCSCKMCNPKAEQQARVNRKKDVMDGVLK